MTSPTQDAVVQTSGIAPIPPKTPEEWLRVLTRRMDLRRLGVLMLRSYVDGNAPLPEMSKETRQSWSTFQRRARTNWGELIIDSVVDRLKPNGITFDGDNKNLNAKRAQAIWRNNRMNGVFKEWVRYGMTFGQSYLTVWTGGTVDSPQSLMVNGTRAKGTVITADSPETMIVVTDPLQHWKCNAAMRVWRNQDEAQDYAIVWTPYGWQQFTRPTYTRIEMKVIPSKWLVNLAEGAWTTEGQPGQASETGLPAPIPVVVYNNPGGHGDYETHIDLINRINAEILERLVIQAMQAFRQRAIKGGLLKEFDEKGNRINWEEIFPPAPGALWNLPEGMEIWESTPADIAGIIAGAKEDIRQLAAVTRTPLPMLMPDNTNNSAEGAKAIESGHLFRCIDRLDEAKFGIEEAMKLALLIDGADLDVTDDTVEVSFANVELITLSEKYTAALAAHNAGESTKSIQRNILGYSPDQIAQDQLDRAQEALFAASLPPVPTTVNERLQGQAPGTAPMDTNDAPSSSPAPNGQQPQPKSPQGQPGTKAAPSPNSGGAQPGGKAPAAKKAPAKAATRARPAK